MPTTRRKQTRVPEDAGPRGHLGLLAIGPRAARRRPRLRRAAALSGVMAVSTATLAAAPSPVGPRELGIWQQLLSIEDLLDDLLADAEVTTAARGATAGSDTLAVTPAPAPTVEDALDEPSEAEDVEQVDPDAWRDQQLAHTAGVEIVRPAGDGVVSVGFHEAARPGALELTPSWAPGLQYGRHPVRADDGDDPGLDTLVLPSRGRNMASSSAMDIAMEAGTVVHAPVTGVVEAVQPYALYGKYADTRVVIRPDANPDVRVVLLHVTGVTAAPGMHVGAGRTPIAAGATPFPFLSQIDPHVTARIGHATPHVHLEVRF